MNKLIKIIAVAGIILSPVAFNNSVSAAGTCEIGFTGPDSNNLCSSTTSYKCEVENNNNFKIKNENNQDAASGTATGAGNTESGDVATGTASNSNGTSFSVKIKNDEVCTVVATMPAKTPSAPVTPGAVTPGAVTPSGGQGAAVTPVPAPAGRGAVTTLPDTGAGSAIGIVTGLVALLGVTVLGSRFAVSTYGNIKS